MEGLALKIVKLKEIISCIDPVGLEEINDNQVSNILQQIRLIFNQIRKCSFCENFISIVLEFVNIINNIAELSLSVKSEVISCSIVSILELITREDVSFGFKVEVLKFTNVLLENCANDTKENLVAQKVFEKLIITFGRQLDSIGDYEFQVGLIECLFRIIPKKFRSKFASHLFSKADLLHQFLDIRDQDFETDCRTFLNTYNSDGSQNQRVRSIPCLSAFLGDRELRKPNDPGYDEFWVDFNFGSNRLSIFCEDCSGYSEDFSEDGSWETLSVWKSDVHCYKISAEEDMHHLEIELANSIPTLYPSQMGVSGKVVTFTFEGAWGMEEAAVQTFGKEKLFIQSMKPKVSLPTNAICVRARSDSPDFEMDSNCDELEEDIGTAQNHLTEQNCPSKCTMPATTMRVKVSVPCTHIVIDSSQNSTTEPVQAIAMKYLQPCPSQGLRTTSEPEVAMCADGSAALSDEQCSPVLSKVSEPVSYVSLGKLKSMKTAQPKSAEIPTPKTPTIRGQAKVKVKTPVVILTPNSGTKSKKSLKKKMAPAENLEKNPDDQENPGIKAAAGKGKKMVVTTESLPGKVDSIKALAEQRGSVNDNNRRKALQKKKTCDTKSQENTKSTTSAAGIPNPKTVDQPKTKTNFPTSKQSKAGKQTTKDQDQTQGPDFNALKIVEQMSKEANKEDFAFQSQDSLINDETSDEICSMEKNGLSFSEDCNIEVECSKKRSKEKRSKVSSTEHTNIEQSANLDNAEITKDTCKDVNEKKQVSIRKSLKSKKGKGVKMNDTTPSQEIRDNLELDVIQSSCALENMESGQISNPEPEFAALILVNATDNQNLPTNKSITAENKSMKESQAKGKKRKELTADIASNSNKGQENVEDGLNQNMDVSVTFGHGRRNRKLNKTHDQDKNIVKQTKTALTCSDIHEPDYDVLDIASTTSENENQKKQTEQQKQKNTVTEESQTRKSNSKKPGLDVYDFDEVDEMRMSFGTGKRAKTSRLIEHENNIQNETESVRQCKNDSVMIHEKKSGNKDRKTKRSDCEKGNIEVTCDEEIVTVSDANDAPILQNESKKSKRKRKSAQKPKATTSEENTRKTRSRKLNTAAANAPESDVESQVDREVEVIQSSFEPENDEKPLDNGKGDKGVFKCPSDVQPQKGKKKKTKQILASTPLDNVEAGDVNFDGENEIISSIDCSNSDGNKSYIEHLGKESIPKDKRRVTEKNKNGVSTVEHNDNFENDEQRDQLREFEQNKERILESNKGKSSRPKRKAAQSREDSKPKSKTENQVMENPIRGNKDIEVDDAQIVCSKDDMQSEDGLVIESDIRKAKVTGKKLKKSNNVSTGVETQSDNGQENMSHTSKKREKRKARQTALESTDDSLEQNTRSIRLRKLAEKESDFESQNDNEIEVIQSSLSPETDEGVLEGRKPSKNTYNGIFKVPDITRPARRNMKPRKQISEETTPSENADKDIEGFDEGIIGDTDSSTECCEIENDFEKKPLEQQPHNKEDEELNCSYDNSLSLFTTNLSQENTIRSLSQRKFFKERSGSAVFERHDVQSACMSAAGVQRKKSCEVEYGNSKNRVYLAMSYSATDRIVAPEKDVTAGDPYDFDKECEISWKRSENYSKKRQKNNSNAKHGKNEAPLKRHLQKSDSSLKTNKSVSKENMNGSSFKEKAKICDSNKNAFIKGKKKISTKQPLEVVDVISDNDNEQDSVCSTGQSSPYQPKKLADKPCKSRNEKAKKEMTRKDVNRLMARFLGRRGNGNTCYNTNENEEFDHHDDLCLSKRDSSSPLKIPQCEITFDDVGIPRLQGENNILPCFKHHTHQRNRPKRARLDSSKVHDDCNTQFKGKQESNSKAKDIMKQNADKGSRSNRKSTFTEEIENVDSEEVSEVSDDQLYRSDDINVDDGYPPENSILTKFNQFCKNIVGESDDNVPMENPRKETSRKSEDANKRKEKQRKSTCRKNDSRFNIANALRTPKFIINDEDHVEICSIKTPMTLPCSDTEGSQESFQPEDLQIQTLQEVNRECNISRDKRLLQQRKNDDLSGLVSGFSTEVRPSRSSLKRKYDQLFHCDDEGDVCRDNLSAGYDLTDEVEMPHFRPRRLFSSGFKAVVEITGSSDDEDKDDSSITPEHISSPQLYNTTSNEMLGGSRSHLESMGVDAGVSMIVKAFGMDFKKQMQKKQHCLDVLAKTAMKSSQKHLRNILTDSTERRSNILKRFEKKLMSELTELSKDVKILEDTEAKTLDFFQQQMKTINNCMISQERRLENLKRMQMDFTASMCHMNQYESNQQKTFKNAMKKDLTVMEKKLLADAQRQELTSMRRSLHTMIG
ncbi:titin homolog isoform X2 [Argopecten irradians]|uniref:titin homolog isoform X2 n=1 Tax=Argopecten irradians TaxID=31199 RepID=UPI00371675F6